MTDDAPERPNLLGFTLSRTAGSPATFCTPGPVGDADTTVFDPGPVYLRRGVGEIAMDFEGLPDDFIGPAPTFTFKSGRQSAVVRIRFPDPSWYTVVAGSRLGV